MWPWKLFLIYGSAECHLGFHDKSLNKHKHFEILQKIQNITQVLLEFLSCNWQYWIDFPVLLTAFLFSGVYWHRWGFFRIWEIILVGAPWCSSWDIMLKTFWMLCAAFLILNRLMETLYNMILFLDILILTTAGSEVQLSDIMYIFISRAEFFVARMCGIWLFDPSVMNSGCCPCELKWGCYIFICVFSYYREVYSINKTHCHSEFYYSSLFSFVEI